MVAKAAAKLIGEGLKAGIMSSKKIKNYNQLGRSLLRDNKIRTSIKTLRETNPRMSTNEVVNIINKDLSKNELKLVSPAMVKFHRKKMGLDPPEKKDTFFIGGKEYPKSEGEYLYYPNVKGGPKVHGRWVLKSSIGKRSREHLTELAEKARKEKQLIKTEMEKLDPNRLRLTTGIKLAEWLSETLPNLKRNPNRLTLIKNEILGGGTKGKGMTKVQETLETGEIVPVYSKLFHINALKPENRKSVGNFFTNLEKHSKKGINFQSIFKSHMNRMVYEGKYKLMNPGNGIKGKSLVEAEAEVMKVVQGTDLKKLGEFLNVKLEFKKLREEAKALGLTLDDIEISHIVPVNSDWRKGIDPNNLYYATKEGNRYLQRDIETQIRIFNDFKKGKDNPAGKVEILPNGEIKIILNKEKRKEHMLKYAKDRTEAELQKDLMEGSPKQNRFFLTNSNFQPLDKNTDE